MFIGHMQNTCFIGQMQNHSDFIVMQQVTYKLPLINSQNTTHCSILTIAKSHKKQEVCFQFYHELRLSATRQNKVLSSHYLCQ